MYCCKCDSPEHSPIIRRLKKNIDHLHLSPRMRPRQLSCSSNDKCACMRACEPMSTSLLFLLVIFPNPEHVDWNSVGFRLLISKLPSRKSHLHNCKSPIPPHPYSHSLIPHPHHCISTHTPPWLLVGGWVRFVRCSSVSPPTPHGPPLQSRCAVKEAQLPKV